MAEVVINISGGSNQVLPNATEAKQIFVGDQFADAALNKLTEPDVNSLSDNEKRLFPYLQDVKKVKLYSSYFATCATTTTLAHMVVKMVAEEKLKVRFDKSISTKKEFLEIVLPLAVGLTGSTEVEALRQQVYTAENKYNEAQSK